MAAEPEDLAARIVRVLALDPYGPAYRYGDDPDVRWIVDRREALRDEALTRRRPIGPAAAQDRARVEWVRMVLGERGERGGP